MRRAGKPVIRPPWEPPPKRSCRLAPHDVAGQPRSMRLLRMCAETAGIVPPRNHPHGA